MIDEAKDFGNNLLNDTKEVIKERFFSPMYFYFIIAWIITNWKFVYALLFVYRKDINQDKINYLIGFYPIEEFGTGIWSLSKLFVIPAFWAFIIVWKLSQLSEKFFRRNEEYKMNIEAIKRGLIYEKLRKERIEDIKIKELEVEKKDIDYKDNIDFNEDYDNFNEVVKLSGSDFLASEILYNSDYDLYVETLNDYLNTKADKSK
jgi:hypothetical protein